MRRYQAFGLALVLDLVGAAGALLIALREWQTVRVHRPAPLHDVTLGVNGRAVDAAPTALALVALAGVVAVLATRGIARRVVGVVLLLAGIGLVVRGTTAGARLGTGRVRSLLADHRRSVDLTGLHPVTTTHPVWPVLTVVCGVCVVGAGVLVAWRGAQWQVMSRRYEAPDPERDRARAAASMWTALDRGDDPTE